MKALYFCNYWQSRIPKVRHRSLVYIFAFRQYCIPGQDFGSSRLRVGVQIPYPVNKVCVSPISAATFRVKSRIPRWEYPSNERKQVRKNTNKETISQKPLIQIFIYLFFFNCFSWSLLDRPQVCHANLLTKNVTSLNYSAKMSFTVYHVTAGNSKTLESVNAYFSFHRHWFSLQWDVADKTIRYFLPNSDLFYLPVVRTDKCWGKKNIQRVSLISTSFDLELATYAENW